MEHVAYLLTLTFVAGHRCYWTLKTSDAGMGLSGMIAAEDKHLNRA